MEILYLCKANERFQQRGLGKENTRKKIPGRIKALAVEKRNNTMRADSMNRFGIAAVDVVENRLTQGRGLAALQNGIIVYPRRVQEFVFRWWRGSVRFRPVQAYKKECFEKPN